MARGFIVLNRKCLSDSKIFRSGKGVSMYVFRTQAVSGVSLGAWGSNMAPAFQPGTSPSMDSKVGFFLPYLIIIAKAKTGLMTLEMGQPFRSAGKIGVFVSISFPMYRRSVQCNSIPGPYSITPMLDHFGHTGAC